jgi:hypothetical protein
MSEIATLQPAHTPLSADERKAALDNALSIAAAKGYRIESRSDYQATIVKGHRPNHILHLILTIITLGIWLIIWILVAAFGGETRRTITVHPDGRVLDEHGRGPS